MRSWSQKLHFQNLVKQLFSKKNYSLTYNNKFIIQIKMSKLNSGPGKGGQLSEKASKIAKAIFKKFDAD